jgi:hypothetical protein
MCSGEISKLFSKHKRQLRDSIILLTNIEVNVFVKHRIDRTDDEFIGVYCYLGYKQKTSLRGGTAPRLFLNTSLNTLGASTLNTAVTKQ